ncbi:MAG: hypothetical protein ACPGOV_03300 [Magnetovibrionaceae bacterium]
MVFTKIRPVILASTLLAVPLVLNACSYSDEDLWPSLSGEDPAGGAASADAEDQEARVAEADMAPMSGSQANDGLRSMPGGQPGLGMTDFSPTGITPGQPTGTFVGKKVIELRDELGRLQESITNQNGRLQEIRVKTVADSQRYHAATAAINTRLQVGTTPGNPILVQQFNSAQSDLDNLAGDVGDMNKLATGVSGDATMSAYLAEAVRAAFNISGAVEEDHRQLAILEDEVNRTVVLIDRLLKEVGDDVRRQTNYIGGERANLNLLSASIKAGELLGNSLVHKTVGPTGGPSPMAADTTGRRPLVVIRFDRAQVSYQQALYNAVSKVLEQRPNAIFDVVAVAPNAGGAARVALASSKSRRHAEGVLRSLVEMGLPPNRVAVSGKTSQSARTSEVHLYLR